MSGHESFPGTGETPANPIEVSLGESKAIIHDPERIFNAPPRRYFDILMDMDQQDLDCQIVSSAVIGHNTLDSIHGRVSIWEGVIGTEPEYPRHFDDYEYRDEQYELMRMQSLTRALERPRDTVLPNIPVRLCPQYENAMVLSVYDKHEFAVIVDRNGTIRVTNSFNLDVNGRRPIDFPEEYKLHGFVSDVDSLKGFRIRPNLEHSSNADLARAFLKSFMYVLDHAEGLESIPVKPDDDWEHILPSWQPEPVDLRRTYNLSPQRPPLPFESSQKSDKIAMPPIMFPLYDEREDPDSVARNVPPNVVYTEPRYGMADVAGLNSVKQELSAISNFFTHPKIMQKWGAEHPRGVLFYGPPGTGKTMLAHALADRMHADVWLISDTLYGRYLGDSTRSIANIFQALRNATERTVVFFDEIDGLLRKAVGADTGGGASSERNSVASVFKKEMDLVAENRNVLIVAATNDLDKIDESVIRSERFNYRIYIPKPDEAARREIIGLNIAQVAIGKQFGLIDESRPDLFMPDIDVNEIAKQTDEMSGADIAAIFTQLVLRKANDEVESSFSAISQQDIVRSIREFKTQA